MNDPSFAAIEGSQFRYKVRVRPTTTAAAPTQCLWGSAGLSQNISFPKPLILHIRNDLFGEPVTFGTQVAPTGSAPLPTYTTIGTLQPGECISIPLQECSGVFATCAVKSTVYCLIKDS